MEDNTKPSIMQRIPGWTPALLLLMLYCAPVGASMLAPALLLVAAETPGQAKSNNLPAEALRALHSHDRVVLYSLEPWSDPDDPGSRLQGFEILGQATLTSSQAASATAAFESAIAKPDGIVASCFDPRHALRILTGGHTYDFLLCYSCRQLQVYRDDKWFGEANAVGSPKSLNELLTTLNLPLSHSLEDLQASQQRERLRVEEGMRRWVPALPLSIRRLWDTDSQFQMGLVPSGQQLSDLKVALTAEIPSADERIQRLLILYGSGEGPWSGYPGNEDIAGVLLQDFPTEEIVAVVQSSTSNDTLLEGAARYLSGRFLERRHPGDLEKVPDVLKRRLLDHTMTTGDPTDDDRRSRAEDAFGTLHQNTKGAMPASAF